MTILTRRVRGTRRFPWLQLIILAAVWAIFVVLNPHFASAKSVFGVLQGFAFLGLITAAVGITIIVGELDLSVGSMAAVGGVTAVSVLQLGVVPAVLLAALIGAGLGLVQGLVIAKLRISSLVLTIGSMFALRGLAYVLSGEEVVSVPLDQLAVSNGLIQRIGAFSPFSVVTLVVMAVVGVLLAYSRYGRELYATGGGRSEARAAGVAQLRPIGTAFMASGGLAGLAGGLSALASGSGAPFAFDDVLVTAITAALIGGLAITGGRGGMVAITLGVLIMSTFSAGLSANGVGATTQQLAVGVLLLIVIVVEIAKESLAGRPVLPQRWAGMIRGRVAPPATG